MLCNYVLILSCSVRKLCLGHRLIQAVSVRNNIVFTSALHPAHSDNGHLKLLWTADHWAQSTFDSQGFPAQATNSLPETLHTECMSFFSSPDSPLSLNKWENLQPKFIITYMIHQELPGYSIRPPHFTSPPVHLQLSQTSAMMFPSVFTFSFH